MEMETVTDEEGRSDVVWRVKHKATKGPPQMLQNNLLSV